MHMRGTQASLWEMVLDMRKPNGRESFHSGSCPARFELEIKIRGLIDVSRNYFRQAKRRTAIRERKRRCVPGIMLAGFIVYPAVER